MRPLRGIGAIAGLLAATAACLLVAAGCSCKQSQPAPHVVQVQPAAPAPAPAGQAMAAAQPAAGPQRAREYAPGPAVPGVGESVLRGPVDYLNTVTVTAPRYAKKQIDLSYIGNEIKQFQAAEGRFPASLKELETWLGEPLQAPPTGAKYSYDPATGKLELLVAD